MRKKPAILLLIFSLYGSFWQKSSVQALATTRGASLNSSSPHTLKKRHLPDGRSHFPLPGKKDEKTEGVHGVSLFGKLGYPPSFTHFSYTNPTAPKGGRINLGALRSFDTMNPWIVKGTAAEHVALTQGTLLAQAFDEHNASYAYIARSVLLSPDRKSVTFFLDHRAVFDNGRPITAEDVLFSFEVLRKEGIPLFRSYYQDVIKAEKLSTHVVRFTTKSVSREMPQILGQFPIFSHQYYKAHSFQEPSLQAPYPPASGPYRIHKVVPGRSVVYKRVENWWAENIPSQKGQNNFNNVSVDYYRDTNALFEAFKSHNIDRRIENSAKLWATGYNFPAVSAQKVIKKELTHRLSQGARGFFLNTRRPFLQDRRVRKALALIFDFNWVNEHLFYGRYKRSLSYFANSPFEGTAMLTESAQKLLEPYKKHLPPEVFTAGFKLPVVHNERERRELREECLEYFKEAGWVIQKGELLNIKTHQPFVLEFLAKDQSLEKLFLNFGESLKKIGIKTTVRLLDAASYESRLENFQYDCIFETLPPSSTPGNELREYFGSKQANTIGSRNFSGIMNPVVDKLIESLLTYETYEELVEKSQVLDRVLLEEHYMIPAWYSQKLPIAYWDCFDMPHQTPPYNPASFSCWWFDNEKENRLNQHPYAEEDPTSFWGRIKGKIFNLFE